MRSAKKLSNLLYIVKKGMLYVVCFCLADALVAQKTGYIDSEYILRNMPAYAAALQKIDSLAKSWESDIEHKFREVEHLEEALENEQVLLTEAMIEERKYTIHEKRKEIEAYKEKIFGYEGLFFLREQELLEVPQEVLYEAIEIVSKKHKLQFMLDKTYPGLLYTEPIHDYTEYSIRDFRP